MTLDTFGVNMDTYEKTVAFRQRMLMAIAKAMDTKKPFKAVLEYNPERQHMAIFTIDEIKEDGSKDGQDS